MSRKKSLGAETPREAAIRQGLKRYQGGKPCDKCGGLERYTSSYACVPCHSARQTQRWHNSEAVKFRAREIQLANKDVYNERRRNADAATKSLRSAQNKSWRDANPDKVKLRDFLRKEQKKIATDKWRAANPERYRQICRAGEQNRRARQRAAEGKITAKLYRELLHKQWNACYWCSEQMDVPEIEHIIPLVKGGTNLPDNVVLACRPCNAQKNDKTPEEWFAMLGCRAKVGGQWTLSD